MSRAHPDGALDGFLAEVTQVRSENPKRLCLVCRTPGHERPAAAHGLCYSCLSQAGNRGQSVEAYIVGDERWPLARPRDTFGMCRMACDALAVGGDGLCGEHLRHWRRAGRPAGSGFEAWREQRGEALPSSRFVDLSGLSEVAQAELLVGISVAIAGHRRARVSDLRRIAALLDQTGVRSIMELDLARLRTDAVRLFVSWAQDHLRLAFVDPEVEWRGDWWDMRWCRSPSCRGRYAAARTAAIISARIWGEPDVSAPQHLGTRGLRFWRAAGRSRHQSRHLLRCRCGNRTRMVASLP